MKKTVLIIMFFFLPLAAFMCSQHDAKTQRAAMDNPKISIYDMDRLGMIWYYFHPISFIDTKPNLKLLKSCRKDNDGETPYLRYKSDWSIGDAYFMVSAEDNTLYSASNRTSIWNNVYCFHDISFDDRQHYIDSIMAIN